MTFRWHKSSSATRLQYGRFEPVSRGNEPSVSSAQSIGFTFRNHCNALIQTPNGRIEQRNMIAGTGGSASGEEIAWIEVHEPFEVVEITVDDTVRLSIADELRPSGGKELPDVYNRDDPVLWTLATRIRSAALSGEEIDDLQADTIGRIAYAHMMFEHLGARPPRANAAPFERPRFERVVEFIDSNLHRKLSLVELADVAALSPYHFLRAFRAATGSTPHAFVAARKMDRALQAIRRGYPVGRAAASVGYADNNSFRAQFRRYIGVLPSKARD